MYLSLLMCNKKMETLPVSQLEHQLHVQSAKSNAQTVTINMIPSMLWSIIFLKGY